MLILDKEEFKQNHLKTIERLKQKSDDNAILSIPTVIHIVYKEVTNDLGSTFVTGDISKEQAASSIDNLNEYMLLLYGTDGYDAQMNIAYYLANIDPDGNETNGIIFHNIDSLGLSQSLVDEYKDFGVDGVTSNGVYEGTISSAVGWPVTEYYNIYVVTEFDGNNAGGGVQGVGYFPSLSSVYGQYTVYNAFGDIDKGYYDTNGDGELSGFGADEGDARRNLKSYTNINKTVIHESGHNINLRHPFGGTCSSNGDFIDDTGTTTQGTSCGSVPCVTTTPDLHMDYFPQQCRVRFTEGQKAYARAAIQASLSHLLESFETVHEWKPTTIDIDFELPATLCSTTQDYQFTVTNTGENTLERLSVVYGSNYATADTLDIVLCLLPNQYKTIHLPPLNEAGATVGMDILKVNTLPYEMEPIIRSSEVGNIEIVVEFVSDILGSQNNWTLERNGAVVASRASYPNFQDETTHLDTICVKGGCLTFTFNDVVGNGVCCFNGEGSLNLYVNGELYATLPETFTDVWSVSNCEAAEIEGYYNFMGEELPSEPTEGWYIIRYTNNTYTKHLKR
jgi:hypothetical protein